MEEYQERVIEERDALRNRANKLADFFVTDDYRDLIHADQYLLKNQLIAMNEYLDILKF